MIKGFVGKFGEVVIFFSFNKVFDTILGNIFCKLRFENEVEMQRTRQSSDINSGICTV